MPDATRWVLRRWPDVAEIERLSERLGVPPEVAAVLYDRGFREVEDLDPPLEPPPLPGIREAAGRIVRAIERGERIRIHGDYDADGVTAAAILTLGLRELGADVHAFIPHRLHDGYGLNMARVPEHRAAADLLVTVDCGVSNAAELAALTEGGVSVIVTDHHAVPDEPPEGLVVHPAYSPALEGKPWPTGAGVAFFVLWAVREALDRPPPLEYTDLAAVGTIADVVPLLGVNRALVKEGLRRLRESRHVGLRTLAQRHCTNYDAVEVAFRIAPRINAAGRLGEAETAFRALTTDDPLEAVRLADRLDALNRERQQVEEEMLERVLPTVNPEDPAIVIHDPEGHPGVMGIVASRVLERFYKPVFIIARGKGSVRSTPGISAVEALAFAAEHLKGYGGHAGAAGFSIDPERVPDFEAAIHAYARRHPAPRPEVRLDGPLDADVMDEVYRSLLLLEPFGEGNPEPVFHVVGRVERLRRLSGGRHVAFSLGGVRVIKWKDEGNGLEEGQELEVAAQLVENEWQGVRNLELRAVAYRRPGPRLLCAEEGGLEVEALDPREALERARREGWRAYAVGEGARFLQVRGFALADAGEADVWFAVPEQPVAVRRARLAVSDRTLAGLLVPGSRRELLRLWREGAGSEDPAAARLLRELADLAPERWLEASPRYRRWRIALAALSRLRRARTTGAPACVGAALEAWWTALARLRG